MLCEFSLKDSSTVLESVPNPGQKVIPGYTTQDLLITKASNGRGRAKEDGPQG